MCIKVIRLSLTLACALSITHFGRPLSGKKARILPSFHAADKRKKKYNHKEFPWAIESCLILAQGVGLPHMLADFLNTCLANKLT